MQLPLQLENGWHTPLGATVDESGINFAVFSDHATRIELCVFDHSGAREIKRYVLHGPEDGIFCGRLDALQAGLVYGFRAYGPYEPALGLRFNPHKLLLDPYAREIVGKFGWRAEHHGYELGNPEGAYSFDDRDNARYALKSRVAAGVSIPRSLSTPTRSAASRVLYEVHVKGFSKQSTALPEIMRGTYAGLAHTASIAHFKRLGVTTLSLLPVQYCVDEPGLVERGLHNYWGYNTLGFFCPDPRWSMRPDDSSAVAHEFREMTATLHAHGLEVILDVVYNHTPEGNEFGPTLSFRGLDNPSWYRLDSQDRSRFENISGCGNTLNVAHPRVAQFVLDSLRYWVTEMGADGFRFDLAPVLGRTLKGFDSEAAFFTALRQDPILSKVQLIAEPWDGGHEGYQLGRFPGRFIEWNDKFRDAVRGYWLQTGVGRGEFARRFTASSDLFRHRHRTPTASVNFVAVHDGYTLADVVAYAQKHNIANGEHNRDGRDGELSCNFGIEGATDDSGIAALRRRVQRAMLATLLLSQGTPMLSAGDELGKTQRGNNNAYCQDNPISWLDWQQADESLIAFVAEVISLRLSEPLLHHAHWFLPRAAAAGECSVAWFTPEGADMHVHDWHDSGQLAFAGQLSEDAGESGAQKACLALLFNPEGKSRVFALTRGSWQVLLDSAGDFRPDHRVTHTQSLHVGARALVLLRKMNDA